MGLVTGYTSDPVGENTRAYTPRSGDIALSGLVIREKVKPRRGMIFQRWASSIVTCL
ncbi:MAG TPA: hypothetical protein PLL71_04575 [Agriterribacter sp.]|nr:hypothetical protein [Agriterribacter sp.]